jgi:AcrR family transcriptional regulator
MAPSTSTKERIIDEAMRLFGEQGYKGTSVVQIEAAAGLTPGAGGIYHHFNSKEAVLEAGISVQLSRLDAFRDIRRILGDLGDLRIELAVMARYTLAELDSQIEMLRILVTESRLRPSLLAEAGDALVTGTYRSFAEWLKQEATLDLDEASAFMIATLTLGSLFSTRFVSGVLGIGGASIEDDTLVPAWVDMVMGMLAAHSGGANAAL